MTDADPKANLRDLICLKTERLQARKEQEAIYGIAAEPHILTEVRKLEAEIEELEAELASLEEREAQTARARLTPPSPPDPFINQEELRRELVEALRNAPGAAQTLVGLGGVGKTALAQQLARDLRSDFPGGALWLSLERAPTPESMWTQIIAAYGEKPAANPADHARALLEQHRPLLILENAESAPNPARALLNNRGAATALITSRDRKVSVGYGPLDDVAPLLRNEAVELFKARIKKDFDYDPTQAEQLCELLGDLPQAIVLAAGYIAAYDEPLDSYLDLLRLTSLGETRHHRDRRELSVEVSFDLSYNRLPADACAALAVLALDGGESTSLETVAAALDDSEAVGSRRESLPPPTPPTGGRAKASPPVGGTEGGGETLSTNQPHSPPPPAAPSTNWSVAPWPGERASATPCTPWCAATPWKN